MKFFVGGNMRGDQINFFVEGREGWNTNTYEVMKRI